MLVCDVVLDSIWYDPRVRKQITEYLNNGVNLCCVGFKCNRYDEEKVKHIPCDVTIAQIDESYSGKQKNLYRKLMREWKTICAVRDAIVAYHPDCIHANDLNALIPAYLATKKLKCHLIYDSHEICVENYTGKRNALIAFVMSVIERHIVRRVDKMICVSHAASEYFAKKYKITPPTVITNCTLKRESVNLNQVTKSEGFEILNHGQFYAGRGYDIMADALPLIQTEPNIKLAIRGFGILEEMLHEKVEQAPNPAQFRFYPKVLVEELIPMASRSHVGVAITETICLNFKLSVSNKLFEYAAAGLPVIMSDIPEHKYLNEKYHFGIVLSDNKPETFAEAVIRLYTDQEFYEECVKGAHKLSEEINWENEFGKLIEFVKSLGGEK